MKSLKFMLLTTMIAVLTVYVVAGSLADNSSDEKYLTIVQSELERNGSVLKELSDDRELLPVIEGELRKELVNFKGNFSVTDKKEHTVFVDLLFEDKLYNEENVLDHIVVVTNTGNIKGYVRTWFAFETGDLTEEEFKSSIILNKNSDAWQWEEFKYCLKVGEENYAIVCAEYRSELRAGETTSPSLLQILLKSNVSSDIVIRLDANNDGKYEIKAYSQVVSDENAWGAISCPWELSIG